MVINLPTEAEARLCAMAQHSGLDVPTIVEDIILHALELDSDDRVEIGKDIERALQAAAEGRERTMEESLEELHRKYGYVRGHPREDVGEAGHAA